MTEALNAKGKTLDHLTEAARQFQSGGEVRDIRKYGNGNVHDTFLVTLGGAQEQHFILQRMNRYVFPQPDLVMRNLRIYTEHVRMRLDRDPLHSGRRWETPCIMVTRDARDHWIDPDGSFWRALSFVDAAQSFDTVQNMVHAGEVGTALGMFHHLVSDLPAERLVDTLEGFHIAPRYLRHYDQVLAKSGARRPPEVDYCAQFVNERRAFVPVLEEAKAQGRLRLRPIHGDPKVNNVMIDNATGQAVGIVDLDTIKPGLVHYDIGDCLRSCCNPLGEETKRWEAVRFEPDLCRTILQGYLALARAFLTANDDEYLFDAIRLIAFELGLRFFADYLEGNVYFKVRYAEHNLARALVQFKLTESIEAQEKSLRVLIQDMR